MKAEEIDAALAAASRREEPAEAPVGGVLERVLPTPEQIALWRADEAARVERERDHDVAEQVRRERALAERHERRKARIVELSSRIEPKLLKKVRATPTLSALLLGPTGCGKTTAARLLLDLAPRVVRGARSSHYQIRAVDLATAERRHGLGDGFAPELVRARNAAVLIIDDVGHERDTALLFDVLDYRYWHGLPVIVTTGLTRPELQAHIGAAAVRRIVEQHAGYPPRTFDCHDLRDTGVRVAD